MKDRILIDGEWYVKEVLPKETFEEINITKYIGCSFETDEYAWEATKIFRDDDSLYPGVGIKFIDKTPKNRDKWEEDYWDNESWILEVYDNEPESLKEAREVMNEKGIRDFKNFIHKLIEMSWLKND